MKLRTGTLRAATLAVLTSAALAASALASAATAAPFAPVAATPAVAVAGDTAIEKVDLRCWRDDGRRLCVRYRDRDDRWGWYRWRWHRRDRW